MSNKNVIIYKIDKLIGILMEKGVQPEELVFNIWRDRYNRFTITKENANVICSIYFQENENEINMIYKYDMDKKLIRIEEIAEGNKMILWDREDSIKTSVNDICDLIIGSKQIGKDIKFIETLPKDIRLLIQNIVLESA